MKQKPAVITSEYLYRGKIINLRYDTVDINGCPAGREIIEHSGGATALAMMNGQVYFVRQYRHPYNSEVLELPAGKIEPGEDPLATIRRELQEEVGIYDASLEAAGIIYPSPGYTDEVIYLFYTEHFKISDIQNLDADECLDIVRYDIETVYQMVDSGAIIDAKTLVLLYKYRHRLLNNGK